MRSRVANYQLLTSSVSSQSYNSQAATGLGEGVGCRLDLKYALIIAAIVSEVEIVQQQLRNW